MRLGKQTHTVDNACSAGAAAWKTRTLALDAGSVGLMLPPCAFEVCDCIPAALALAVSRLTVCG